MMDYKVISSSRLDRIWEEAEKLVGLGFRPHGPLVFGDGDNRFNQVMVREDAMAVADLPIPFDDQVRETQDTAFRAGLMKATLIVDAMAKSFKPGATRHMLLQLARQRIIEAMQT